MAAYEARTRNYVIEWGAARLKDPTGVGASR